MLDPFVRIDRMSRRRNDQGASEYSHGTGCTFGVERFVVMLMLMNVDVDVMLMSVIMLMLTLMMMIMIMIMLM